MNFDYNDDQQAIKRTAHDMLVARFKPDTVRALAEGERYDQSHWDELCELGWPGIFIDEQYEGQGLGTVELVILLEELGYTLAPVPFLSNAVAGLALQYAGSDEQKDAHLKGIATGAERGTVGTLKNGVAELVPDADTAKVIIFLDGDTAVLHHAKDCDIEPVDAIDQTRRYSRVVPGGDGEVLPGDVGAASDRMAVAISAELVGIAQKVMEMAVDYARDRKQFDRPIGAYQAVAHRCADMLRETESARSATLWAAWAAEAEPETLAEASSMAKALASDAGWNVTSSALQVHGGIAFTWEHDLHFFLKRAKVDGSLFGSARKHRDRVADLHGLGAAA